ncbi:MAG: hypothetical protein QOH38_1769 [Thermoleophilaceae bacterium]|nr:hypothetical protein [Thermoleophilaceae bacterium]
MPEREESDPLPEEGPSGQVHDDDESQGASRDDAEKQAGTPGDEGQDGDGQASGNPANAG